MNANKDHIINFIKTRLRWAKERPEDVMPYLHQAFGAICFYIDNLDEYDNEWEEIWETYRHEFEKLF